MSNAIDWLLEEDAENPGPRAWALTDLLQYPDSDPRVAAACRSAMETGPVPAILDAQNPAGYWEKPGPGYLPKYRSTVWSMIYLAQLGADPSNPQVQAGGEYLLTHAVAPSGVFSMTGTPSGNISCLAGNLGAALLDLGFGGDERLTGALEWMARYVTGEGIAPNDAVDAPNRYFKSGMCGPGHRCSANYGLPCGWGAVKVLRALARVPQVERTRAMQAALDATVDFLFSVDPATADYPVGSGGKPSGSWFKFGFPVFYVTDVLQTAEALTDAGFGGNPRLAATYDLILSKRDGAGRWNLQYSYEGKTWADVGQRGKPNKWVTLRAMRVLQGGGVEV
jgi:hypothetical protein